MTHNYEQILELDRLHRAAIVTRRAYRASRSNQLGSPKVFELQLARDFQEASAALADYLRQLKALEVAQ